MEVELTDYPILYFLVVVATNRSEDSCRRRTGKTVSVTRIQSKGEM